MEILANEPNWAAECAKKADERKIEDRTPEEIAECVFHYSAIYNYDSSRI